MSSFLCLIKIQSYQVLNNLAMIGWGTQGLISRQTGLSSLLNQSRRPTLNSELAGLATPLHKNLLATRTITLTPGMVRQQLNTPHSNLLDLYTYIHLYHVLVLFCFVFPFEQKYKKEMILIKLSLVVRNKQINSIL